jgi:hypothetical protein
LELDLKINNRFWKNWIFWDQQWDSLKQSMIGDVGGVWLGNFVADRNAHENGSSILAFPYC